MHKYLFFLGSNPELSLRELTNVLKRRQITYEAGYQDRDFAEIDIADDVYPDIFDVLGGTERVAEVLAENEDFSQLDHVQKHIPIAAQKLNVGFSSIGYGKDDLHQLAEGLKQNGRNKGIKIRFILPKGKSAVLNAAQVIFNRLDQDPNSELILVQRPGRSWLARTKEIQDIKSYELRDTSRPARDARIGMLPPKLAQIMLNLVPSFCSPTPSILDPFCGMGTILQEGWLMDWKMAGSDTNPQMTEASEKNLDWLARNFKVDPQLKPKVWQQDATRGGGKIRDEYDAVVTEPFLGKPLSAPLSAPDASHYLVGLVPIYLAAFKAWRQALKRQGYVVMVWPAVKTRDKGSSKWVLLPQALIDAIEAGGYSWLHQSNFFRGGFLTKRSSVMYAREDAMIGREMTVWQKN